MPTKSNFLSLNQKQRKLAEALVNPELKGTISAACEKCGVARSTFYKWMELDDFCAYLEHLVEKYAKGELAAVWRALLARCKKGDVQAIKLYFELLEKARTPLSNGGKLKLELDIGAGSVSLEEKHAVIASEHAARAHAADEEGSEGRKP